MRSPAYTAQDFYAAMQALKPRGLVWPRDDDDPQSKTILGLAKTYERGAAAAVGLLFDAFPANTTFLLPEWEASVGLPDDCAPLPQTVDARRAQVLARFIGVARPTKQFYVDYAQTLGFHITIDYGDASLQTPLRCGVGHCGDPLNGGGEAANPWAWFVTFFLSDVERFKCGVNHCGDPLVTGGPSILECELRKISPEHTVLVFVPYDYSAFLDRLEIFVNQDLPNSTMGA